MGAQRASWQSAFAAEMASLLKQDHAQALLDLVKAFELIPHEHIVRAAIRHGYPLRLLRLSRLLRLLKLLKLLRLLTLRLLGLLRLLLAI